MFKYNFHTHSNFSDGVSPPEKYVEEAIRQEFIAIGFSEHAPLPDNRYYTMSREKLAEYISTIKNLGLKYQDTIKVYCSLELDYVPELSTPFNDIKDKCSLDYTIGSIHLVKNMENNKLWFIDGADINLYDDGLKDVFNGDIKKGVTAYYEQLLQMINIENPDIIGHLDKIKMNNKNRYFLETEGWYQQLTGKVIYALSAKKCIVEVNTRGIYKKRGEELFPGIEMLKKMYINNIPITLSSDAHQPHEISGAYNETLYTLRHLGFKKMRIFEEKNWKEVNI